VIRFLDYLDIPFPVNLHKFTIPLLKEALRESGLKVSGVKAVLIKRLLECPTINQNSMFMDWRNSAGLEIFASWLDAFTLWNTYGQYFMSVTPAEDSADESDSNDIRYCPYSFAYDSWDSSDDSMSEEDFFW